MGGEPPIWVVDMERPVLGASRPGARPSHPWPRAARSGRLAALGHGWRVQVSLAPRVTGSGGARPA